ncbi:MAG: S49 family peptidase [Pseudomonadota bacterium]
MSTWIPLPSRKATVAVVRLSGMIASGPRGLNDQSIGPAIEKAFNKGKPKAVALVINSPGGSAAQSALIAARIRRLSEEKEIPVFAFVEDVAASGGYWLATAADEIFVDGNSIVGSIGVISASFGFHELITRYGVERRVHTAGQSKSFMDPFKPEKPEDVARLKDLQEKIHANFIEQVKSRRSGKLPEDRDLFTGEIWVGGSAIDVGLVDGVGHLKPVMEERFGKKVKFSIYGAKKPWLARFGAQLAAQIEERALWARYGL